MNRKEPLLRVDGQSIFLRYPTAYDAAEFIALNCASREFHKGLVSPPTDRRSYLGYLLRNEKESNECFFICTREDGAIAGAVNLAQIFRADFRNASLGYFLGAPFAGQGIMTEAIGLILKHSFRGLRLHRVEASVQPDNEASKAVLRRNGFANEGLSRRYMKIGGRWRDHERWAIIAEDWRPKNSK